MTSCTSGAAWRKSSFCETDACVEVARTDEGIAIRSSNAGDDRVLRFTQAEWAAFLKGVHAGEFHFG